MAPHSSTLAWKIPWMEEPGRLQSIGSLPVGHNWTNSLSLFTFTHRRRKRQPTPVFLPGESQGRGSLVGCRLWGCTQLKRLSISGSGSDGKESACKTADLGLIPGLGWSTGEGHSNPLQYSCLKHPHEQWSLVGYSPCGHKMSDTAELLSIIKWHKLLI